MEKLAVLSFAEENEQKIKIILARRNRSKGRIYVETKREIAGDFLGLLENAQADELANILGDSLKEMGSGQRFFYVTLPDSLISYKCFISPSDKPMNLKKKRDYQDFCRICAKENPNKKNQQDYILSIVGEGRDQANTYHTCAYVLTVYVTTLEMVFAKLRMPFLALEPSYYSFQRLMRVHFPKGPLLFHEDGNYFLSDLGNIFSLYSTQEDADTNEQVLMAIGQKALGRSLSPGTVRKVQLADVAKLPVWIDYPKDNGETLDYISLCGIGSTLRGMKFSDNREDPYGLGKIRKFFKR